MFVWTPFCNAFISFIETTKAFREFLLKEMSAENLDFWVQVESYKQQKPAKQEKMAKAIFETYIAPGAPKEVRICDIIAAFENV